MQVRDDVPCRLTRPCARLHLTGSESSYPAANTCSRCSACKAHFVLSAVSFSRVYNSCFSIPVSSNPKLNELLSMVGIPFKSGDDFGVPRRLTDKMISNLDDVIQDRADTIRLYLSAVWTRFQKPPVCFFFFL